VLGGLADYSEDPCQFAIATDAGRLVFIGRGQAAKVAVQARDCDIAKAVENKMWVIRADVAGRTNGLVSYGSSGIVDPDGMVAQSARELAEDLVVAQIDTVRREKLVR
jgi:predicted amidohydrolase